MATKKFSPAQIAAQKLFAERARAGTLGQRKMRKPGQAGRPTAEAFEQSAMTAKRNPDSEISFGGNKYGKVRQATDGYGVRIFTAYVFQKSRTGVGDQVETDLIETKDFKTRFGAENFLSKQNRKTNPDKAKPRAYVKRASQATGRPPVKGTKAGNRLITRRKKALSAPAGYFPNPKAAMMTGYQVICMHPKKHVVGIFKTMAEAKLVARAMADAKGVAYAVKTVKVHKTHFAV